MSTKHVLLSATALGVLAQSGHAGTDTWSLLKQIDISETVTETTYEVKKTFPTELRDGAIEVEITGYAVPRIPGDTVQDIILVSDMGLCPFCGSLDHGGNLQVLLENDIPSFEDGQRMTLRGTLEPVTDPETWQAAILKNARIVPR